MKISNTITDINARLLNDEAFRNVVCKIDELSEAQLERADKLIDLFFTEPFEKDKTR